jgi:hypothetical protein
MTDREPLERIRVGDHLTIRMERAVPLSADPPRYLVIQSGDVKVGDQVRVLELIDGAYREIEGGCRVVEG